MENKLITIQTEQLADMDKRLLIIAAHAADISLKVRGLVASALLMHGNAPIHLKDDTILRGQQIDAILNRVVGEYL